MEIVINEYNNNNNYDNYDLPSCISELNNTITYTITDTIDYKVASILNYNENYTVKMLKHIASYYGFKYNNKIKKQQLIDFIVDFESKENNTEIIIKRNTLWSYMEELLHDNYTKQFIINMNNT